MNSKTIETLFTTENQKNGSAEKQVYPLLQVSYVTIHLDTGIRHEDVIASTIPQFVAVYNHGDYYTLEARSIKTEELSNLFQQFNDMQSTRISDYQIRQKEIKFCPDMEHPEVGLVIGQDFYWNTTTIGDIRVGRIHFDENKERNFILNNGMRLALSGGAIGFEDNNFLTARDMEMIDAIMERQQHPDWFLSPETKKNTQPESGILQEISALFQGSDVLTMEELKITKGVEDSKGELDSLIGMENIKQEIRILEARLRYVREMERRGYQSNDPVNLHMCFLGAPGTGKTTVARILTGLFANYGYIKKNKCIEISARQLVGAYVGQTGDRTAKILQAAKGGVLFLDETYTLLPAENCTNNDFSHEAVAQLLKGMEDSREDLIVILAGYYNDMQKFFDMNEGLRSRVNKNIFFENYTLEESIEIFLSMLRKEHYKIDRPALEKLWLLIKKCRLAQGFSNGRFVRNLYERLYEQHAYRVYRISGENADTITLEDLDDRGVCEPILRAVR